MIGDLKVNRAALATFSGLAAGDLLVAWLSYQLRSRKRPLLWFMGASAVLQLTIMHGRGGSSTSFYALLFLLGMATANALYVTTIAEQFGTNLRDTAATTITNLIRFGVVPLGFVLTSWKKTMGFSQAGFLISLGTLAAAILALSRLRESYGTSMEFEET